MKKIIAILILAMLTTHVKAQNTAAEEQAIEKQVDAMVNSWNNHNYIDMKNYTTADADWVNIVGQWWQGRAQMQFAHQFFHNRMFKQTALKKNWVKTRLVAPTVAIVHFSSHVGKFTTPGGAKMPESDDLALLVFVKQSGKWLIASGENVVVNEHAKASDPVLHMPK